MLALKFYLLKILMKITDIFQVSQIELTQSHLTKMNVISKPQGCYLLVSHQGDEGKAPWLYISEYICWLCVFGADILRSSVQKDRWQAATEDTNI